MWIRRRAVIVSIAPVSLLLTASPVHASFLEGETLDSLANVLAWVVLIVAPSVCITVFWLLHILPEKIAYRKHHPQAQAIHALCLLSLFFGGLLWPLAWLWTFSRPVMYKLAYGTDTVDHGHGQPVHAPPPIPVENEEVKRLRARNAELEAWLNSRPGAGGAPT